MNILHMGIWKVEYAGRELSRTTSFLLLFLLAAMPAALAQVSTATISGTVKDESGSLEG